VQARKNVADGQQGSGGFFGRVWKYPGPKGGGGGLLLGRYRDAIVDPKQKKEGVLAKRRKGRRGCKNKILGKKEGEKPGPIVHFKGTAGGQTEQDGDITSQISGN